MIRYPCRDQDRHRHHGDQEGLEAEPADTRSSFCFDQRKEPVDRIGQPLWMRSMRWM